MKGEDNPADLMTKHLTQDKMLRCLQFMNAEYRAGRPEVAPRRKDNKHIVGEDMNWQVTETARNELDDDETELRLARENEQCQGNLEELMEVTKVPSNRAEDAKIGLDIDTTQTSRLLDLAAAVSLRRRTELELRRVEWRLMAASKSDCGEWKGGSGQRRMTNVNEGTRADYTCNGTVQHGDDLADGHDWYRHRLDGKRQRWIPRRQVRRHGCNMISSR